MVQTSSVRAVDRRWVFAMAFLLVAVVLFEESHAEAPKPAEILRRALDADSWGLADAEIRARVVVKNDRGTTRELAFSARSRRYAPPLTKSLVRFTAPPDVAGVGFLQVQKSDGDDERYLFLPELGKAKRIAGKTRTSSFMGTDFSYADLDRRDLRDAAVVSKGETTVGKKPAYHLVLTPKPGAPYTRVEMWVQTDNFVAVKTEMYNASGTLVKTLQVKQMAKKGGRWFLTRSLMTNHAEKRTTELVIDQVEPRTDIPDVELSRAALEKT